MITTDFVEGQIYTGKVVSIKDFGAFLEFALGKEGMVHISKIAKRGSTAEDVLTLHDKGKSNLHGQGQDGKDQLQHQGRAEGRTVIR